MEGGTLPVCVWEITDLAGKEAEYPNCNLLMSILQTMLHKHTPSGCLFLLNMEFIGIVWYNFSLTFPKPRHVNSPLQIMLQYFGGKHFHLNMFKEMLENFIPNDIFCRIGYLFSNTVHVNLMSMWMHTCTPTGHWLFKVIPLQIQKWHSPGAVHRAGKGGAASHPPTRSGFSPSCSSVQSLMNDCKRPDWREKALKNTSKRNWKAMKNAVSGWALRVILG